MKVEPSLLRRFSGVAPWLSLPLGRSLLICANPCAEFDALPTSAKLQILAFVGLLEIWSESNYAQNAAGNKHYMSGGKPGVMPSFAPLRATIGHPVLDLFDPFGFSKNAPAEKKEKGLLMEINNGRLAQIGIMAFVAESKVPGSVPLLTGIVKPYAGEPMAFFSASDKALPYVEPMLNFHF
jgi:Chlorophyll A-B binding protein